MTVSYTQSHAVFGPDGVATIFYFSFWFFQDGDLVVKLRETDGTVRVLTQGLNYSVEGAGNRGGGKIIFTTPPASGTLLFVRRVRPLTQLTALRNQGGWFPEVQEDAFDHVIMLIQQLRRDLDLALKVPDHVYPFNTEIVPASGQLIGWNDTGTGLQNVSPLGVGGGGGGGSGLDWETDIFDGDGSRLFFELSRDPGNINNTIVAVDGVLQSHDAYTLSDGVIVFTEPPPNLPRCVQVKSGSATNVSAITADNVSFRQTSSSHTRSVSSRFKEHLSITDFDTAGTGGDDSLAMQSVLNEAASLSAQGLFKRVYIPTGIYLMNSVLWDGQVPIDGENTGYCILRYNGDGASGSFILGIDTALKVSWPTMSNLYFDGWDGVLNSGKIAEHLIKNVSNAGWDLHGHFRSCSFMRCWGDAFNNVSTQGVVNLHFDRLRFDSVGGFAMAVSGNASTENRPITVSRFSYDNNLSGNFLTTAQTMGKYNGTQWGKGLLRVADARGLNIHLSKGRIECNKPLIDAATNKRCLIHVVDAGSGNLGEIQLDNVGGFCQQRDAAIMIYDPGNRVGVRQSGDTMSYRSKFYESGTLTRDLPGSAGSSSPNGGVSRSAQGSVGVILNGSLYETRPATAESQYIYYKLGDRIQKNNAVAGDPAGYSCTAPTVGYALGLVATLTASAATTSGNASVSWVADFSSGRWWGVGMNIKLIGAGVAGADLSTYITAVNPNTNTFTVNTAPSTTLGTCTIESIAPTWTPYGQIGYRSNAGTPSGVLTPKFIGERVLDSTNSVWYSAVGAANTNWAKDSP